MIRNLIWDVDGTLFDTYPSIVRSFLTALGPLGGSEASGEVLSLARIGLTHCAHALATRHNLDEDELAERFSEAYRAVPMTDQHPFSGVARVCEAIVAGGGVNAIVTHRARASTEALLVVHGIRDLFGEIVAGDEGFPRKPDAAAFLSIIGRTGIDARETAAVGDRGVDVVAGKAAGLRTCLFLPEGRGAAEGGPDLVFSDYTQLLEHLQGRRTIPAAR